MAARTSAVLNVKREPIPLSAVADLVQAFLGTGVEGVVSVHIDMNAVTVESYAINADGDRYLIGHEVAIDRIHIPVV